VHGYCVSLQAGSGARCRDAAVVEPLARRLCDLYGWLITDGRAAEAPAAAKTSAYLPVEDLPPKREVPTMTSDERMKLQKELIAARDRQLAAAKAQGAASAEPVKP
jgi:hypothetical protein